MSGERGTVGIVRPTQRTGGFEELKGMLPDGIRLVPHSPPETSGPNKPPGPRASGPTSPRAIVRPDHRG